MISDLLGCSTGSVAVGVKSVLTLSGTELQKFISLQLISGKSGQHLKEGTAWNSRNVQELFHQKANGAGLRKTRRDCCYRKERNTEFKSNTKGKNGTQKEMF